LQGDDFLYQKCPGHKHKQVDVLETSWGADRTQREQEALLLVSDYVDLTRKLIKIAKDHGAKDDIINNLLNSNTMNHGLAMIPRKYSDILVK
jgi:hypothetical protein